jgi:hypothetical protein
MNVASMSGTRSYGTRAGFVIYTGIRAAGRLSMFNMIMNIFAGIFVFEPACS